MDNAKIGKLIYQLRQEKGMTQLQLAGELNSNEILGGNMITAMTDTGISCCGKKLQPLQPHKADEKQKLNVARIENDFYITANHPMEREHYIPFVALLTSDTLMLRKLYPEWELQVRIPIFSHGRLLWYCNRHGLFYQDV